MVSIPARSRQSGEQVFVGVGLANDYNYHASIISYDDDGSGKLSVQLNNVPFSFPPDVGEFCLIVASDVYDGFHTVLNVDEANNIIVLDTLYHPGEEPEPGRLYVLDDIYFTGQATDNTGSNTVVYDQIERLGEMVQNEEKHVSYDVSLTFFVDDYVDALRHLLGDVNARKLAIDHTKEKHIDLFMFVVDKNNNFLYTTVYEGVKWESLSTPHSAGRGNYVVFTLSGKARNKYILG